MFCWFGRYARQVRREWEVSALFAIESIEFLLILGAGKYEHDQASRKVTVGEGMWIIAIVLSLYLFALRFEFW